MRRTPLGLLAVLALAGLCAAAKTGDAFDPAVSAAVERRWPGALAGIARTLAADPGAGEKARPAVGAALQAGAAFAGAESGPDGAAAKSAAARSFRAALDALGPAKARLLDRTGGLGAISRDVLGGAGSAAVPKGEGGLPGARAEALEKAGRRASDRAEAVFKSGRLEDAAAPEGGAASAVAGDARPATLAVAVPKVGVEIPDLPAEGDARLYVSPGTRKLAWYDKVWNGIVTLYAVSVHGQSPEDRARLKALRGGLDGIETGRGVVAELGGWKAIDKKVDMRMADLPGGTMGMALPLDSPDAEGHTAVLLMSRATNRDPDAVTVSVLAHELSHVKDFGRGGDAQGLAIPSEMAAHRLQIHAFLEAKARMTPDQIKAASGNRSWEYMNFITALWVDHILRRFPGRDQFRAEFSLNGTRSMAGDAYDDLRDGKVAPGSPQLDYHLTAPESGLYTKVTDEKDIQDIVAAEKARGVAPSAEQTAALEKRARLLKRADEEDEAYRRAHGFELGGDR